MEFKVGDIVKVKDIEDLIKRGRCDEKTARHISGVKFIINAFVVKSNAEFNLQMQQNSD